MHSGKIKFILDFDDFAPVMPGMDNLLSLKEHFPNFKCTCFTSAFSMSIITRQIDVSKMKEWFGLVKQYPWIEIAPHGFVHQKGEGMTKDAKSSEIFVTAIENLFKENKINFVKVFKAPFWEMSEHLEKELFKRGYTIALNRDDPMSYTDAPKYVYNWSIDEPIPDYHTIKGHGHVYGTNNGLNFCLPNLLKIPQSAEFLTIGEYLKL